MVFSFEAGFREIFRKIMGAGTVFGVYNVALQYQQHNASHANCISSSAEHKEDSKTQNLNDFQL